MLTLNDGRTELWQWDTGRTLDVDADCSQVHFSNKVFGRSIDVDVTDGVAIIPDILLQTDKDLNVWAFVGTAENGYTKISKTFKVNRRNKPSDYVFTQTDQMTLQTIQRQIGDLSDLTTEAKDTLVAAINEALTKGGGEVADKAANVYIGPVQPTDGTLYWLDTSESGSSGGETITYSITAALTNVTIDNTAESVNEGESFSATLTASVGYELSSVKITMSGADITNAAYASGNIYISAVTGDVVITAVAVEVSEVTTYTITNNLVNATSDNSAVSAEENASYTATLTAADGYTLEGATVTIIMGGVNVTSDVYADGVITIPAVTGDVVINVTGAEYIGEPVSMAYLAKLQKFSGYYSDNGVTPMETNPRDRGGFYSGVFQVDTKITASFDIYVYQHAYYGYGNHILLGGDTSYFYGGVYCESGTHKITITVPAGNRFMIIGTFESQCTNVVVHGKEV